MHLKIWDYRAFSIGSQLVYYMCRNLCIYGKRWDNITLLRRKEQSMLACSMKCWTSFWKPYHVAILTIVVDRLISEALGKMKGKIHEIASSHVSSRVLQVIWSFLVSHWCSSSYYPPVFLIVFCLSQACIKNCSQDERDNVFEEIKPHLLLLACNTYAVHLVKKLLDTGTPLCIHFVCDVISWLSCVFINLSYFSCGQPQKSRWPVLSLYCVGMLRHC